jgi:hypothetical protein
MEGRLRPSTAALRVSLSDTMRTDPDFYLENEQPKPKEQEDTEDFLSQIALPFSVSDLVANPIAFRDSVTANMCSFGMSI